MMAEPQQYSLRWNNYLRQLTYALDNHRCNDEFVDVTLLCDGRKIKAHKVVLSACSSYFREIFIENPHPHPMIIFKFIKYEDLNSIIKFMYQGEVNVEQEGLQSFLQTAEMLNVHGLNAEGNDKSKTSTTMASDDDVIKSTPGSIRAVSASSLVRQNVDVTKSIQDHRTSPSALHVKLQPEHQRHEVDALTPMNTQPTLLTTNKTTLSVPSCSNVMTKKRKIALSNEDDDSDYTTEAPGELTLAKTDDTTLRDIPEYILGEVNDALPAAGAKHDNNQSLESTEPIVTHIKSEYEIFSETDMEENYQNVDNAEMTIEMRRLFNPSSAAVPIQSEDTASCSNIGLTGNKDNSGEMAKQIVAAIEPMFSTLTNEIENLRYELQDLKEEKIKSKRVVMPAQPFKDIKAFFDFENALQENSEMCTSFENEVTTLVAKAPNFIRNSWKKLLTDSLAEQLCWKGTESKRSVRSLCITEALRNAALAVGNTEEQFIKDTRTFFQFAKNRIKLRNNYQKKKSEMLITTN